MGEADIMTAQPTHERATWGSLDEASSQVAALSRLADALERYAGPAMAAPLQTAVARIDDALTETFRHYRDAIAEADGRYTRLEADKDHHIEHLVHTRSQRTVALAGVADYLRTAVDHVAERARKSGRDLPEWHARASAALADARTVLDS